MNKNNTLVNALKYFICQKISAWKVVVAIKLVLENKIIMSKNSVWCSTLTIPTILFKSLNLNLELYGLSLK